MIILLVLLPALVLSEDSLIDWTKCVDNRCFCLGDGPKLNKFSPTAEAPDNTDKCAKVGLQNKFFTEDSVLFQMQVMGEDTNQLGDNPELKLYNGDKLLFGCKIENGVVKLVNEDENRDFINKYQISLFEDRSRFKQGIALCAVKSNSAKSLDASLVPTITTTMKLNSKEYAFGDIKAEANFFQAKPVPNAIKCDPDSFKNIPSSKEYKILPLRNTDNDVLNCDNYGENAPTNFYSLRYQKLNDEPIDAEKLECKMENGDDDFYYHIVTKKIDPATQEPETVKFTDLENYYFFCAAKMDELCQTTVDCNQGDPICPKYHKGEKGVKARLECPFNKWLIYSQYYDLTGTPVVCKNNEFVNSTESAEAAFVAVLPGGEKPINADARCFTDYDCTIKSNIKLPKSDILDVNGDVMKCNDQQSQLTIFHADGIMNSSSSYTCDKGDGQWKNGSDIVPAGSRVICKSVVDPNPNAEATASEAQVIAYTLGIAVGIIAFCAAGAIIGFCCWKYRKSITVNKLTMKNLSHMERSDIIKDCKEEFGKFLQADPSTYYLIIEGLKKVDQLLKSEVEDPEAWEEAYKFLMRVHGTIRKVDRQIYNMFSRYLYLESKKIIDKHGWSTATPIRNSNQKGLLRAVAVHLLSFSIHDNKNDKESEKLLSKGFRELGFKGVSQYPHCGLLWSVIYHTRPRKQKLKSDPNKRTSFHDDKFEDQLRAIFESPTVDVTIPRRELIPAFGSVPHQAAFALGAVPDNAYIEANSGHIVLDNKPDVSLGYFEGLLQSVMHNPIENVCSALRLTNPNPKTVAKLHKRAPAEDWNALVKDGERVVTYYGRHMDAKRLHERFMPDDKGTDFFKMQMEQQQFEEALEKAKPDLRSWFAAHTDIEDFKKKPVDFTNPKVNLAKPCGDWVPPPPKEAPGAGSKSRGLSGSQSSDPKGSGNGPAAADPKDAAAAAAAPPPSDPKIAAAAATAGSAPHQ